MGEPVRGLSAVRMDTESAPFEDRARGISILDDCEDCEGGAALLVGVRGIMPSDLTGKRGQENKVLSNSFVESIAHRR